MSPEKPGSSRLRVSLLAVALCAIALWLASGGDDSGDDARATASGPVVATKEQPVEPSLGLLLADLRREGEAVTALPDGPARQAAGQELIKRARALGDQAMAVQRTDITADIGRVLIEADETAFAEAFLQRSVGVLKPDQHGKDAMYPLAQLRRVAGRPLEAASLYERAIDIEPTLPAEFVGLSDLYLAAGRMGPARAAVSRGLARHGESTDLAVQGAKVALLDGRAPEAIASLRSILSTQSDHVGAQLVYVEALFATGALDQAAREAQGLREDLPEDPWGWIFGGAGLRALAQVEAGNAMLEKAAALTGDCACTHEERLAIAWASSVPETEQVAPRSRTEAEMPVPPPRPKAAGRSPEAGP